MTRYKSEHEKDQDFFQYLKDQLNADLDDMDEMERPQSLSEQINDTTYMPDLVKDIINFRGSNSEPNARLSIGSDTDPSAKEVEGKVTDEKDETNEEGGTDNEPEASAPSMKEDSPLNMLGDLEGFDLSENDETIFEKINEEIDSLLREADDEDGKDKKDKKDDDDGDDDEEYEDMEDIEDDLKESLDDILGEDGEFDSLLEGDEEDFIDDLDIDIDTSDEQFLI